MQHFIINASSARVGGALTYLREIVPPLQDYCQAQGVDLTVLVSSSIAVVLNADSRVRVCTQRWMSWPGVARVLMEQLWLPFMLRVLRADAVLCVGDNVPLATRVPSVMLCRNGLIYQTSPSTSRMRLLGALARASLRRAAVAVAVSSVLADEVRTRFPGADVRVIHHGSGLHLAAGCLREELNTPKQLLCVGSFYRHKRFELAIAALSSLRDGGTDVNLRIVGGFVDPEYRNELARLVAALALDRFVEFVGEQGPADVVQSYLQADALLVTSSTESFCHPILEGFQAGIPVIAVADLPVTHEVAGDAALLCPPSAEKLAEATRHVLNDSGLRRELVAAGTSRALQFSWPIAARATGELMLSIARAR